MNICQIPLAQWDKRVKRANDLWLENVSKIFKNNRPQTIKWMMLNKYSDVRSYDKMRSKEEF